MACLDSRVLIEDVVVAILERYLSPLIDLDMRTGFPVVRRVFENAHCASVRDEPFHMTIVCATSLLCSFLASSGPSKFAKGAHSSSIKDSYRRDLTAEKKFLCSEMISSAAIPRTSNNTRSKESKTSAFRLSTSLRTYNLSPSVADRNTVGMASFESAPNPLRPYYKPPTIGPPPEATINATTLPKGSSSKSSFSFPDLDYSDYIPDSSPSTTETLRNLVDKAVWKYTSVLIAQPFEVAKTILQVYVPAEDADRGDIVLEEKRAASYQRTASYRDDYDEESEDDEPNYFSSSAPYSESPTSPPRGRPARRITDRDGYIPPTKTSPHSLTLKTPHSLLDALSSVSSTSGALSMWKGTNATFVYSILLRTAETFFRSLIAAVLGLPDTDLPSISTSGIPASDILTTATPIATLLVTTVSSFFIHIILSPRDTARTRLILTPSTRTPRSLLATIRTLPTPYVIPAHLIPITTLHSLIPSLLSSSSPLFLKSYLSLDPILNPTGWSIATFTTSAFELILRLPLETILRRAQIATFTSPTIRARASGSRSAYTSTVPPPKCETIVPVQQHYRGIFATAWSIVHEEGYTTPKASNDPVTAAAAALGKDVDVGKGKKRKGQGVAGLYRGWRVGMWGLVGVWGAGWMGGMATGAAEAKGDGVHGAGKF